MIHTASIAPHFERFYQSIAFIVHTAEAHCRMGLTAIACANLIEVCKGKCRSTWWDCAKQNTRSANLARKIGFQDELEYRYVWWRRKK